MIRKYKSSVKKPGEYVNGCIEKIKTRYRRMARKSKTLQ